MLSVAILDMYKGEPNQGMRNIQQLVDTFAQTYNISINKQVFDVRGANEIPNLAFDVYISSGGPGSPIDTEGWEASWKSLVEEIIAYNRVEPNKKWLFLICHSFQLMCFHFNLAEVNKRQSESFGIFPMHPTKQGKHNAIIATLPDPFFAVDSRKWQVIQPNLKALEDMGAKILAIEKHRPQVSFERATMAIEFTPEIFGTQFHPEADAKGMLHYLGEMEKKELVIQNYGLKKYNDMVESLEDPKKIALTQQLMLPVFLRNAHEKINQPMASKI
jgi:GMP synthase-like glutamine amidotransferase